MENISELIKIGDRFSIDGNEFNGEDYIVYRKNDIIVELTKDHINNSFYYLRISPIRCSLEDHRLTVPSYCILEFSLNSGVSKEEFFKQNKVNNLESEVFHNG